MSFNLISVAILVIAAVIITFEVIRALSRSVKKSVIALVSVFISLFVSIVLTILISDAIASGLMATLLETLKSGVVEGLDVIYDRFPNFESVAFAYSDAIVSSILFVVLFIVIRIVLAIVFALIFRHQENKYGCTEYENEEAAPYKKKPKFPSAILGVVSGLLVTIILVSPVVGTLKVGSSAVKKINETSEAFSFRIKQELVDVLDALSNDAVGNVFYYSGGALIYKSTATSILNDNHFELEDEVVNSLDGIDDLLRVGMIISNIDNATKNDKMLLSGIGDKVEKAETLKTIGADLISDISKKWLKDEMYYSIPKPKVGNASSVFFDKMLYVCKSTTPDTVASDLSTLINVFVLADQHEILNCDDHKTLVERANQTGAFVHIKKELQSNVRMVGVSAEIDNMVVRAVASVINNFTPEEYDRITASVTNTLNEVIDRGIRGEERIVYITGEVEKHMITHDVDAGSEIVYELAEKLSEELLDTSEVVTEDEVRGFWEKYTLTQDVSEDI